METFTEATGAIYEEIETKFDFLCAVRDGAGDARIQDLRTFKYITYDLPRTKLRAQLKELEAALKSKKYDRQRLEGWRGTLFTLNTTKKIAALNDEISKLKDAIEKKKFDISQLTDSGPRGAEEDSSDSEETVAGEVDAKETTLRRLLEEPLRILEKDLTSKQKKEGKLAGKNRWLVLGNKANKLDTLARQITDMNAKIGTINELLHESRRRSGMFGIRNLL